MKLAACSAVLAVSLAVVAPNVAAQASPAAPVAQVKPRSLSEVRSGMSEDSVLAGLSERYNITREKNASFVADVSAKSGDEDGTIIFKDGKVLAAGQRVTPYYRGDAVTVSKDLLRELIYHTTPATPKTDTDKITQQYVWNQREGTAHVILRQWTAADRQTILLLFEDGTNLNIEIFRPDPNGQATVVLEKWR
jgi:hypothetical protein